jgi:hypothetical protein
VPTPIGSPASKSTPNGVKWREEEEADEGTYDVSEPSETESESESDSDFKWSFESGISKKHV